MPEGIISRVLRNKKTGAYPRIIQDKFKIESSKSKNSNFNPGLIPSRSEKFEVKARESFINAKYTEFSENGLKYFKLNDPVIPSNEIKYINIQILIPGKEKTYLSIKIDSNVLINELKLSLKEHVSSAQDFKILHSSKMLKENESLYLAGIKDYDELEIQYISVVSHPSEEILPKISNLKSIPNLVDMSKMSISDLKKIKNFTLENQYGRIVFEGETDVIGLNVDKAIRIEENIIYGYPGIEESLKVYEDQRLNKPAIVTLFNFKSGGNKGKYEIKLRISCEKNGTEFIKYDENTYEFSFKIKHL